MKKQKKQNLLTAIIIILVLALTILVGSIVYEEIINMNKQLAEDTSILQENQDETDNQEEKSEKDQEPPGIEIENEENTSNDEEQEEYVGEEEQNPEEEDSAQNIDEKAIQLAKKEWGNDDTVIFSIVDKNDSKYRISVTKEATVLKWYEIDTKTWEISEY